MNIAKNFTITRLPKAGLHRELIAGITLAALAIPEVMAYAKIAGTPVITGLYTMLIPVILFALVGSSKHLVVGADSATAAMLSVGLAGMAAAGSSEYIALAGALAFLSALLLLLARLFRLGFLANFLSRTVLIGFLTGVGAQVAMAQIAPGPGEREIAQAAAKKASQRESDIASPTRVRALFA